MGLEYTLKRSTRARTMRIAVQPDARVMVTIPRFFSTGAVEGFLAKHAQWIERALARTKGQRVIRLSRKDIVRLKRAATSDVAARCAYFAELYDVQYKKISIRAHKSRWGSCSGSGTLSFNYKIAALSERVADYIIVHEICHLREMNHSKKFWDLVAQTVPEHQKIRKKLHNIVIVLH